jgi:hypothetical protein
VGSRIAARAVVLLSAMRHGSYCPFRNLFVVTKRAKHAVAIHLAGLLRHRRSRFFAMTGFEKSS